MKNKNIIAGKKRNNKKGNLKCDHQRELPLNPVMPRSYSRTERAELRELEKRILMRK